MTALPKPLISPPSPPGTAKTVEQERLATATNRDVNTIVALCAVGLLILLNVMLRYPDLGSVIERYNRF